MASKMASKTASNFACNFTDKKVPQIIFHKCVLFKKTFGCHFGCYFFKLNRAPAILTQCCCRAYIECSAREMRGLSPILQEAYRCAVHEAADSASSTNGHGGFGGFPSIIRDDEDSN